MASHRRPKSPGKARVTVLTAAAATAVALSSNASALAAPQPTKSDVKSKLDSLYQQSEAATQKYDQAKSSEASLQKQVNQLQDKVAREQASLTKLQESVGQEASAQYRSGGIDPTVQLMLSSNPDQYLSQASSLSQLTANQASTLRQIESQKRELSQQRTEASTKLSQLQSARKAAASNKAQVKKKVKATQNLLDSLTAKEKAALARQQAEQNQAASRAANRTSPTGTAPNVKASGRAAVAIAAAKAELGKPYVYGATGPNAFDCSGLMQYAWRQAGVSLPRTSYAQENAGPHVPLSQAQPGDLVIFYGGEHVGMYVGNGEVIHAPHTGDVVRYAPVSSMPLLMVVHI